MTDKFDILNENQDIINKIKFNMFVDDLDDDDDDEVSSGFVNATKASFVSLLKPETVVNNKQLYVAQSYKDFEMFVLNNVKNNPVFNATKLISYDIETNAEDPKSTDAKIIGFSIAFSSTSGIYLVRESLDYKMSDEDWEKSTKLLVALFKISEKVIVHNMEYEVPYTINCLNYELTNNHLEDTMVKCRILYPNEPSGLKPSSARLLGYDDWDMELFSYISSIKKIITELTRMSVVKRITDKEKDKTSDYALYENFVIQGKHSLINPKSLHHDIISGVYVATDLTTSFLQLFQVLILNDLMDSTIFEKIKNSIIASVIQGGLKTDVIPYSLIPMKIIAKYGAIDAVATYQLNEHCDREFPIRSENLRALLRNITQDDTFNFFDFKKGYEIVKAQFDAGINLQLAGAYWDDSLADLEMEYYSHAAKESWVNLFNNKKFKDLIKSQYEPIIVSKLVLLGLDSLSINESTPVSRKVSAVISQYGTYEVKKTQVKFFDKIVDEGLVGKVLIVKSSNIYKLFEDDFNKIFSEDSEHYFDDMLTQEFKTLNYKDLSKIFNPNSSKENHYALVDEVINCDRLKYGYLFSNCMKKVTDDRFWESYPINELTKPIIDLFTFLDKSKKSNESAVLTGEKEIAQRDIFKAFYTLFNRINIKDDNNMYGIFMESMSAKVDSLKESKIIDIYQKFKLTGIDIEDESTWTPEFAWLYNFRIYKKSLKMINSYILGKVGRKSVTVVDKNKVSSLLPVRLRKYNDTDGIYDKATEELIISMSFNICGAETGRWRSGMHTIPAGSTIKNIYRSRYKGGVICAPDYSQMEVRAIAASAKEKIMLDVFKNGEDIHLKTASKVWKKDEKEITDAERRFSKSVTFAVLYGANEKNIADNFMMGDYNAAKEVMDGFYQGYPRLKVWVDAMHALFKQTGYVPLTSSRIIHIKMPQKDDPKYKYALSKGLRQAQNYPIQGLSNDIAGYALYLAINYIKQNELKSKAISFVHDALYFDIHPKELFKLTPEIDNIMNEYPIKEFDLPAAADLVIGVSMGQELVVEDLQKVSDSEGFITLSGYLDDFDELIKEWSEVYSSVSWEESGKSKNVYVKKEDLFLPKKAISRYLGTTRTVVKRKVHIKF
jgi:DNA polymerase I-like protein with 3'-5' exonuclease and polymerase domains